MKKLRYNTITYKKHIEKITKGEFTTLSEYKGYEEKMTFHHSICGTDTITSPKQFMAKKFTCYNCRGGVKNMDTEGLKKWLKDNMPYLSLNEGQIYKNNGIKMSFSCIECGNNNVVMDVAHLKYYKTCPSCSGNIKSNLETFKKRVYNLVGDEYTVLSKEYINNHTKIEILHNICENTYMVQPKDFYKKNGNRCPYCKRSKGEEIISSLLNEWGYKYETQVSFPDCKNINILKFDFKIYLNNKNFILIEYDGRLHYEPYKKGKEHEKHLEKQQKNDKIKDDYCKKNSIKLIRISYKDNIEEILRKILRVNK